MNDGTDKAGTVGAANLEGSDGDSQQSSITVTETDKQLKALQRQVDELTRTLQSQKDKGIAKTNQRIDSLEKDVKSVLRTAHQRGQSVQDVLTEMEALEEAESRAALLEMAQAFKSGRIPGTFAQGSAEQTGVDVTNVLRDLELDVEDVRVKEFASRQFASESEAYREAARLVKSISTKRPSGGDQPSFESKGAPTASKEEALRQEYAERSKDLRGQQLMNLKMEMRKKGLRDLY